MTHQDLFGLGFAAEMMTNIIATPTTLIIYRLLAPVSQHIGADWYGPTYPRRLTGHVQIVGNITNRPIGLGRGPAHTKHRSGFRP